MLNTIINGHDNTKPANLLVEFLKTKEYGEQFSHAQLAGIAGVEVGSGRYRSVISKAKKLLLNECGVELVSAIRFGYRIQEPYAQVQSGCRKIGKAAKRIRLGIRTIAVADRAVMTEPQRKTADYLSERGEQFALAVAEQSKALSRVGRMETLPAPAAPSETK